MTVLFDFSGNTFTLAIKYDIGKAPLSWGLFFLYTGATALAPSRIP